MDYRRLAQQLLAAEETATPLATKFSDDYPAFSMDEAYQIQRLTRDEKLGGGRRIVGKKIGATSQTLLKALAITDPIYGNLFDSHTLSAEVPVDTAKLIAPKIEGEIAVVLKDDLAGPGVTVADVFRATHGIMAGIELVDSRFGFRGAGARDFVADNANTAGFLLGNSLVGPVGLDLRLLGMFVEINGQLHSSGTGVEVLGHPFNAVAWLANKLAEHDSRLQAGEIILTGAITGAVPVAKGDIVTVSFDRLGTLTLRFN